MPAITKSQAKLTAWEWTRELDRIALPLIAERGIGYAYLQAALKLEGRRPCGGRLGETGRELVSDGQDLASGQKEGNAGGAK